jgi:hypothetical protein
VFIVVGVIVGVRDEDGDVVDNEVGEVDGSSGGDEGEDVRIEG